MSSADDGSRPAAGPTDPPTDPPPYAWLDDPAQPFGPVGTGTTLVVGSGLAAVGLFSVVLGVLGGPDARAARLVMGGLIALIGAVIVRMGTARRAWRRRNPGLDPLEAARASGANVGSALGNDSLGARLGRGVLVLVCAFVVLVCVVAVQRIASGQSAGGGVQVAVVVLLGLLALLVGGMTVTRPRRRRR